MNKNHWAFSQELYHESKMWWTDAHLYFFTPLPYRGGGQKKANKNDKHRITTDKQLCTAEKWLFFTQCYFSNCNWQSKGLKLKLKPDEDFAKIKEMIDCWVSNYIYITVNCKASFVSFSVQHTYNMIFLSNFFNSFQKSTEYAE